MNWINKILRKKEINQCAISGVSIRFSRKQYDKRRLAPLYFTVDYTVNNSVLYLKGEEYSPYNWNYDRMTRYVRNGVLSENVC
jgi:hypothetical protein